MRHNRTKTFGGASTLAAIAFLILFASQAKAQLALSMTLSREAYLVYENVQAKVYFRNLSGRPLVFGANEKLRGTLTFHIIGPDGKRCKLIDKKIAENLLVGIVLGTAKTDSVVAPISHMYDISKPGNYTIYAVITHPLLKSAYKSKEVGFTVFNGVTEWKRILGVPDVLNRNKDKPIEERTVRIISFYDGKRKLHALKIEDDKFVYCVHRLVQDLEGGLPTCMVDGLSRIHIFAHTGSQVFAYYIYDIDGKLVKRKIYKRSDVDPRIVRDRKSGRISIVGGEEAILGNDYREESINPFFEKDLGGKRN